MVLVHGAFHGGWCWSETSEELQRHGVKTYAPSLTGLADRRHLCSPSVNLATHVNDIVNLIEFERLDQCVLVGHSYAGNVLVGVADQLRERVSHYIFVDAAVPPVDARVWGWGLLNPALTEPRKAVIDGQGFGMVMPPFPAQAFGLTEPEHVEKVASRLTPMPRGCLTEPIVLENGGVQGLRCSYIAAANPPYDNMKDTVSWVSKSPDWAFTTLDTCHDMMITKPRELARKLLALTE